MGNERGSTEERHFDRFDRLPPPFRRAIRTASRNWKVGWVEAAIKTMGHEKALTFVRGRLVGQLRRDALDTYGPDHPQAGAR